jgi:hypothetical protein
MVLILKEADYPLPNIAEHCPECGKKFKQKHGSHMPILIECNNCDTIFKVKYVAPVVIPIDDEIDEWINHRASQVYKDNIDIADWVLSIYNRLREQYPTYPKQLIIEYLDWKLNGFGVNLTYSLAIRFEYLRDRM